MSNPRVKKLYCLFEDNEAVIKMIINGRSPTMRHISRTHRVALDWLFDRISMHTKIQIKYIDTKNQLADILTKGNFTRDEWNHLLSLFDVSHFSSTICSAAMSKRVQQGSGEERVTGGLRLDIKILGNLLRETIDLGNLIDSPQQVIQKWIMVILGLLKSGKVRLRRTIDQGNLRKFLGMRCNKFAPHHEEPLLDGNAQSVRYAEIIHDGSGQPDSANHQEEANSETFVMGSDAAEFVNKVKDQVRSRQKRMSNVAESGEEHSTIWRMFMSATMNAATHGKEFLNYSKFH